MYQTLTPSCAGCDTRSIFEWGEASLNSVFFFLTGNQTKLKEPSQSNYYTIAGRRMVLASSEIQTATSRI